MLYSISVKLIPVVCGTSLAEIAGSNPAVGTEVCVFCVLYSKDKETSTDEVQRNNKRIKKIPSGAWLFVLSGHCEGPITHPEESYRL
jgi:hypothetical protein